jgi:hypothetical protein
MVRPYVSYVTVYSGDASMNTLITPLRSVAQDVGAFSRVQAQTRELRAYQTPVARAVARSVREGLGMEYAAVFARQSGKDEMLAQLCAWLLWLYQRRGGNVIIALPALRPQGIIARDRLIDRLDGPLTQGQARVREGTIVQLGRASVRYLSAAPTASSRGNTADLLLVANEAQDIHPDTWDSVFAPMAASSNATALCLEHLRIEGEGVLEAAGFDADAEDLKGLAALLEGHRVQVAGDAATPGA